MYECQKLLIHAVEFKGKFTSFKIGPFFKTCLWVLSRPQASQEEGRQRVGFLTLRSQLSFHQSRSESLASG